MNRCASSVALVGILILCGCSGPPETAGQSGPSAETDPDEERSSAITRYETFDASKYAARPPAEAVEVDHRVPDRLLRGRADEGIQRRVQGYRIQVFSARDQSAAQDVREQVQQWWEANKDAAPEGVFREDPRIVIRYSQPYYRVRIGTFVERDAAEEGIAFIRTEYPSAFIARTAVTARR